MDESVEVALQLNLDPRKPGQALRGSFSLPHGNGKKFGVAVFTDNMELAKEALTNGAVVAGGASLIEDIKIMEMCRSRHSNAHWPLLK